MNAHSVKAEIFGIRLKVFFNDRRKKSYKPKIKMINNLLNFGISRPLTKTETENVRFLKLKLSCLHDYINYGKHKKQCRRCLKIIRLR